MTGHENTGPAVLPRTVRARAVGTKKSGSSGGPPGMEANSIAEPAVGAPNKIAETALGAEGSLSPPREPAVNTKASKQNQGENFQPSVHS